MAATRIDCDIHPAVGGTRTTLLPYLDDHWKEQVVSRAIDGLDLNSYPPNMPFSGRADWRPDDGGKPGSDLAMVQRGAFDQLGASHAICNVRLRRAGGVRSLYGRRLLQGDQRLDRGRMAGKGSAAARLDRGADAGAGSRDRGNRAPRRRQPLRLRAGAGAGRDPARQPALSGRSGRRPRNTSCRSRSTPAARTARAPSSIGWPSYRYEYYLAEAQAFQAQILSLVYEGVFGKFPDLKVVLMESGVSWLPAFMWRANKTWRGVRVEVPWVEREPASIIRDHFRVTMQPFDGPPDAAGVADVIEQIGSDKMFLFASDYPHWQFDGDDPMPPHLPASIVARMCADNPLETFPRLKLAA